jgi:rSAM/selenodomain-associated transferase 1
MRALVMAKAPKAGQVKTRLGADIGMEAAAYVAAAALLDTLAACRAAFDECHLALDGDLGGAAYEDEIRDQLADWHVHPQQGDSLGERLAHAHARVAGAGPTVQVGMDTPQVTADDLREAASATHEGGAVLGPAADGGWWVLALRDPSAAAGLAGVPRSRPDTYRESRAALERAGLTVETVRVLRDVDTVADAHAVVAGLGDGHFRRAWEQVTR